MRVKISLQDPNFTVFGYIPNSGIAGSYSSSIFNFLRNFCTVFHIAVSIYIPIFSLHPYKHVLSFVSFIIAILTGMKWYLIVVLICTSLIISNIEHFSMSLLAINVFFEKCLFMSFAHFLIRLFVFLLLSCLSSLCI